MMAEIEAWIAERAVTNRFGSKTYDEFTCHIANLFDPRAHANCECRWYAPYGFVVEAGCPEHD